MHKQVLTIRAKRVALTVVVVAVLGGCAQTKSFLSGMKRSSSSSGDVGILGAPAADDYLAELYDLAAGDPATQAEIYADARVGIATDARTADQFALCARARNTGTP